VSVLCRLRSCSHNIHHICLSVASQLLMLCIVDTWYHFGHRLMHKSEWLWQNIHSHHHVKKNLNVFSTAYTEFVENLVLVAPVREFFRIRCHCHASHKSESSHEIAQFIFSNSGYLSRRSMQSAHHDFATPLRLSFAAALQSRRLLDCPVCSGLEGMSTPPLIQRTSH
jgi:hypothetical protein